MVVFSLLMGVLSLTRSALQDDSKLPQQEALMLRQWLVDAMTISNQSGRAFSLLCAGNITENFVQVEWQNPIQTETYTSLYGCGFIRYSSAIFSSIYSPQWHTLVPAITIKVSRGRAEHYVVISQNGRVRTAPKP